MNQPATSGSGSSESLPGGSSYIVVPQVLLTESGPQYGWAASVVDGTFGAVGPVEEVVTQHPALVRHELAGSALIPGFIDSHQHLTQAFAKSIIGGQPAQIWKRIWLPMYDAMTPDDAYIAAKWTCIEALRGGFTTVVTAGEIDPARIEAVHQAVLDVGIRCVLGHEFSDQADFDGPSQKERMSKDECIALARVKGVASTGSSRITTSLTCGSGQSASKELIGELASVAGELGLLFQIHASEHTPEVERALDRYGRRPIELLYDIGALGTHTLVAHATLATSDEIGMLADTGTRVSYNPVASAWKGNGVAQALEFASRGVEFGLGTDATRMDGFRLIDAAETAQRLTTGLRIDDWVVGHGQLWVNAATVKGSIAAGLGSATGAIESGRHADFLILDTTGPECRPSWDFTWDLVRSYDRSHLQAVYIDGDQILVDGRPIGWDLDVFLDESEPAAKDVIRRANLALVNPAWTDRP